MVEQLVQIATFDDDLKTEIDALDTNGFNLLHYCCLYSLDLLIPVLLSKGANIDRCNSAGCTSLHLAAGSGHVSVARALVEGGATVSLLLKGLAM